MGKLKEAQRRMMNHALGNTAAVRDHRNHYWATIGEPSWHDWRNLERQGFATGVRRDPRTCMELFTITPAGRAALEDHD